LHTYAKFASVFSRSPGFAFGAQRRKNIATLKDMLDRVRITEEIDAPQGASPLILLPGTLCDDRVFAPVINGLDRSAISVPMAGAASTAAMADRILANAPERFALCGFSLGAIVALEVFAQSPQRIERLCLIGGNARPMPPQQAKARRAAVAAGPAAYIDGVWESSVPTSRRDDAELRAELMSMATAAASSFADQVEMSIDRADSRPHLAEIDVPTLVIVGAEDRICPPFLSEEIAAGIAGARLLVIPNAGHYVTLDQPEIVRREIQQWLAAPSISKELK
jgi:pimeloyl-ACP methyl ester carboxylesterase